MTVRARIIIGSSDGIVVEVVGATETGDGLAKVSVGLAINAVLAFHLHVFRRAARDVSSDLATGADHGKVRCMLSIGQKRRRTRRPEYIGRQEILVLA